MSFEVIFFWLTSLLVFELFVVKTAAYLLALLLSFAVILIFFLFWLEFDILASLLFGVYSSVFIVFFLLLLHFTTFWASAVKKSHGTGKFSYFAGLVFIGIGILLSSGYGLYPYSTNWTLGYLWQDIYNVTLVPNSMLVHILHLFFFRIYVYETILLNFYLFFSLVLALGLLGLFKLYSSMRFVFSKSRVNGLNFKADRSGSSTNTHVDRTRQITKFRRQTRRQNSSILKHK